MGCVVVGTASKSVNNDEWYVSHWSMKEDGLLNTTIDCNNIFKLVLEY